jgi:hypothetical protein
MVNWGSAAVEAAKAQSATAIYNSLFTIYYLPFIIFAVTRQCPYGNQTTPETSSPDS